MALERVTTYHAIVVAAAGNSGPAASPALPASEPRVIGVTDVDDRPQPYSKANRGDYVDFAAPARRPGI